MYRAVSISAKVIIPSGKVKADIPRNITRRKHISCHPETPDEQLVVSVAESGDFFSWQGNQWLTRRRTSVRRTRKTADLRRQWEKENK